LLFWRGVAKKWGCRVSENWECSVYYNMSCL
jgi:hypothetical protein